MTEPLYHHCIWEVVDNSVDEHLAGHTSEIKVYLHEDAFFCLFEILEEAYLSPSTDYGISAAEVIMTKLHAGGKFDNGSYEYLEVLKLAFQLSTPYLNGWKQQSSKSKNLLPKV